MTAVVKDCNVCHGKAVVRVRFVNDENKRYGQTRVITCPDCRGRGSWIAFRGPSGTGDYRSGDLA